MKNLILIGGTMGVGKTTTCRELQKLLPNCVFLDGDWCWDMQPFVVNEETKAMVMDNITHLLRNFLSCSAYNNVIFCWVMHEESIIRDIRNRLEGLSFRLWNYSLVCSKEALEERLSADIQCGRRSPSVIGRSVPRLPFYEKLDTIKLDVSTIPAAEAAKKISDQIRGGQA